MAAQTLVLFTIPTSMHRQSTSVTGNASMDNCWTQQDSPTVMNEYLKRSGINKQAGDKLEVAEPPKLRETNFHQWEDAILVQLHAKKGNNNVLLAYVVWKPTPLTVYADETKRLIYEAIQTRSAWE